MHTLRPYQEKLVHQLRTEIVKSKKVIGAMATGGGKTAVFIDIASKALMKNKTVLIITESRKIFSQIADALKGSTYEISAKKAPPAIFKGSCYIAMAQTLVRRKSLVDQFEYLKDNLLIINDEAHINTATGLLEKFPDAMLLGFTATPQGKHLKKLYNACVVGPQPDELVRLGFLSPYKHFARVGASMDKLIIENGEFTEDSQKSAFDTQELYDGLTEDLRHFKFKKCMIFCASIAHCEAVYSVLSLQNFKCVRIHSQRSNEQDAIDMYNFKYSDYDICVSVGSLTKGFDWPPVDLIVLNRATTSTALFLQMDGRGSRISPGKDYFTVLDYGENYRRHGLWDQDRDWDKIWNQAKDKKDGVAPIKICPKCDYINKQSAKICENCGHEFELGASEDDQVSAEESELIEITKNWAGKKMSELNAKELAVYARLKNKKAYAIRIAKSHATKDEQYLHDFGKAMGYKPSWSHIVLRDMEPGVEINFYDYELK